MIRRVICTFLVQHEVEEIKYEGDGSWERAREGERERGERREERGERGREKRGGGQARWKRERAAGREGSEIDLAMPGNNWQDGGGHWWTTGEIERIRAKAGRVSQMAESARPNVI